MKKTNIVDLIDLIIALVSCSLFWSIQASAWNPTGHAFIGQIAYENLSKEHRKAFTKLLENHPRFEADFVSRMPSSIAQSGEEDQDQWFFRQAGSWPDKARAFRGKMRRRFHQSRWHYINYPLEVGLRDSQRLVMIPSVDSRGILTSSMNAVQAIEAHRAIVQDADQEPSDRALSLAWICHLVGDLHQPLHTTALFTAHRFTKGDRGGNSIPISGQGSLRNLHSFWDNVLGRSVSNRIQIRQAAMIIERFPVGVLISPRITDVSVWVSESVTVSNGIAYGTAILAHISANEDKPGNLSPVHISESYRSGAHHVAEERVALAGYRLAAVLAIALSNDVDF